MITVSATDNSPTDQMTSPDWFSRVLSDQTAPEDLARYEQRLKDDSTFRDEQGKLMNLWDTARLLKDDPDIQDEIASTRVTQLAGWRSRRQPLLQTGLGLAAAVVLAWGALFYSQHSGVDPATYHYRTAVGQQQTVTLPDDSRITLNTGTELRIEYSDTLRRAELMAGEATFDVTSNTAQPFEVHASGGVTRVLGTLFNVERRDNGTTRVSVMEGKVQVHSPDSATTVQLVPGQAVEYDLKGLGTITAADQDRITAWHKGRIEFHNWPLADILREYNRYSAEKMYVDPGVKDIYFSGSFTLENKDELIKAIENAFNIQIHTAPATPSS